MILTKQFLTNQYIILGKSGYQIAKEFKLPKYSIHNYLKKFDIKCRTIRESRQPKESKKLANQKWCNSCKLDKPFFDFAKNNKNWHKLDSFCRNCMSKKAKKYFPQRNKNRQNVKAKLVLEFGNFCSNCKVKNLPIACYTFHHHSEKMNGKNYKQVGLVLSSNDEKLILSEKSKWILLCSNCHNLFHSICKLNAIEIIK